MNAWTAPADAFIASAKGEEPGRRAAPHPLRATRPVDIHRCGIRGSRSKARWSSTRPLGLVDPVGFFCERANDFGAEFVAARRRRRSRPYLAQRSIEGLTDSLAARHPALRFVERSIDTVPGPKAQR